MYLFSHRRYRLPFKAPVRTARGAWTEREGVIVRLESEDGRIGWGEAAPLPGFSRESMDELDAFCRSIGDRIVPPVLPFWPASLSNAMSAAMGGVDAPNPNPAQLPVAALLPAGRAALEVAPPLADAEFRVFKWKVGVGDWQDEIAILDDLCALLPPGAQLRLDANGAWDRRKAERWLDRCSDRPVEFVEQPVAADGRGADDLLMGLAADYPVSLALDESLAGDEELEKWLGNGWPGVFVIKTALHGDPDRTVVQLDAAGADVVFSSALETAVGARSALAHAFGWSGNKRALGFGVWPLYADSRMDGPCLAPFLRWEDVERIDPEAVWNALI